MKVKNKKSLPIKNCIITGATSGVGKASAIKLAQMGLNLFLIARNPKKAKDTIREIKKLSGNKNIELIIADLQSQKETRLAAKEFIKFKKPLHILINNAGLMSPYREVTEDHIEKTFAVNHLAGFLLTNLLLGTLKKGSPARIINVASVAHVYGKIHFEDINLEKKFSQIKAYGQSKLANILFTTELARRLDPNIVTANAMHPGTVASNFFDNDKGISKFVMTLARPFMKSPEKAAETVVYLATSPELEKVSGKYFFNCKEKKPKLGPQNEAIAEKLWDISSDLTNL